MNYQCNLRAYRCAIHVHTDCHDGEKPVAAVVADARAAGVEILFLSDHNEMKARDNGWGGMHEGVFVVVGAELGTRDGDHLLTFGIRDKVATKLLPTPAALELLHKLGAIVFAAHPQGRRRVIGKPKHRWSHWQNKYFAGVEIWAYMHDWIDGIKLAKLPAMCREPGKFITGPEPWVLQEWDSLAQTRHVAGIGALDSHGKHLPLGLRHFFPWAKDGILPYAQNFKALATYLLAPELSGDDRKDERIFIKALAAGKCWTSHDELYCGREFYFAGETGEGIILPGEEIKFAPGLELRARAPQEARIKILNRGAVAAETVGTELRHRPDEAGEYRAEAFLGDRPWLYSNHVYLRG
jgi:hypothetical protein